MLAYLGSYCAVTKCEQYFLIASLSLAYDQMAQHMRHGGPVWCSQPNNSTALFSLSLPGAPLSLFLSVKGPHLKMNRVFISFQSDPALVFDLLW